MVFMVISSWKMDQALGFQSTVCKMVTAASYQRASVFDSQEISACSQDSDSM